jgi:hypothetical protein
VIAPPYGRAWIRRIACVALVFGVTTAGRWINVPHVVGKIKGDEATYVSMALSLAYDHDLAFQKQDLDRFHALYGQGPEGIFLKRRYTLGVHAVGAWPPISVVKTAVPTTESLAYGKALAYPLAAAPFVLLGGLGGMLLFNWILLAACLGCAVRFCQARMGRVAGACLGGAFIAASVVPVYGAWLTSEVFNFALIVFAYFLWLQKKVMPAGTAGWLGRPATDALSAALIGVAVYSKATNLLLIAPLLVGAMAARRWRHAVGLLAVFALTAGGLVGLTAMTTGEPNYQGGDRKSFVGGRFPFDESAARFEDPTFGNPMVTDDADTQTVFDPQVLALLPRNAYYFLLGRDAGLIPFYGPGVIIGLWWLVGWRRASLWQWTTAVACAASVAGLLIEFPYTWNGGGGPPGNRYFLSLYPTLLFLVPAGMGVAPAVTAWLLGAAFTGAMVVRPFAASNETWRNVERAPLRWLPIELTLINDLPVRLYPHQQRGPVLFSHEPFVYLYYMDGNTYFAERDGFWVAGHAATDIIVRTDYPLTQMELQLQTSRTPNTVHVEMAGRSQEVTLGRESRSTVRFTFTPQSAVWYHKSYGYVLHLSTTTGFVPKEVEPGSTDSRNLGVFVRPTFAVRSPNAIGGG